MSAAREALRIVPYEACHAAAFRDLNLAWIEEHFAVEEPDRQQLLDPVATILAPGGAILIAERAGAAIGCCALLKHGERSYELAKMAVDRSCRSQGVGRKLLAEAVRCARALGAAELTLTSNTRLAPALHLYRELGFVEAPIPNHPYTRVDIAMVLPLA